MTETQKETRDALITFAVILVMFLFAGFIWQ